MGWGRFRTDAGGENQEVYRAIQVAPLALDPDRQSRPPYSLGLIESFVIELKKI
jgi:hypothetical protein